MHELTESIFSSHEALWRKYKLYRFCDTKTDLSNYELEEIEYLTSLKPFEHNGIVSFIDSSDTVAFEHNEIVSFIDSSDTVAFDYIDGNGTNIYIYDRINQLTLTSPTILYIIKDWYGVGNENSRLVNIFKEAKYTIPIKFRDLLEN